MGGADAAGHVHNDLEEELWSTSNYKDQPTKQANCTAKRPPDGGNANSPADEWVHFCKIKGCRNNYHCETCFQRKDRHILADCAFARDHKAEHVAREKAKQSKDQEAVDKAAVREAKKAEQEKKKQAKADATSAKREAAAKAKELWGAHHENRYEHLAGQNTVAQLRSHQRGTPSGA